ncbi:hypothetical protein ACXP2N_08070 [Vibrio alginolyticus]|uniref:hypothetical protein n=1 Tax=Vibrio alginolyticus TaxID=663 RepID=UPI001BD21237|nr:hypothetical protein [Vibrio alginolyticus]MBS9939807.1 hypothetical protein [Vibrio alginolyticus]HCG6065948.1 hypothetical protein [Vibrio parahaemolyticus]
MDLFETSTFDLIEESPIKGLKEVLDIANENLELVRMGDSKAKLEILWNACILIANVIKTYSLEGLDSELPKPDSNESYTIQALKQYLDTIESDVSMRLTHLNISDMNQKYSHMLKSSFAYEFSQGDYERVQRLINELREHISSSTIIDDSHKHRLLKKLERLQSELHKRVPDLDRLWGLVGDAGVALGKFGDDVKPLVDRVKEIAGITWNTQKRAEELPSETPNPMLESSED